VPFSQLLVPRPITDTVEVRPSSIGRGQITYTVTAPPQKSELLTVPLTVEHAAPTLAALPISTPTGVQALTFESSGAQEAVAIATTGPLNTC
jgi:hypothetical protein